MRSFCLCRSSSTWQHSSRRQRLPTDRQSLHEPGLKPLPRPGQCFAGWKASHLHNHACHACMLRARRSGAEPVLPSPLPACTNLCFALHRRGEALMHAQQATRDAEQENLQLGELLQHCLDRLGLDAELTPLKQPVAALPGGTHAPPSSPPDSRHWACHGRGVCCSLLMPAVCTQHCRL